MLLPAQAGPRNLDLFLTQLPGIAAGVTCATSADSRIEGASCAWGLTTACCMLQATSQDLSPGSHHQEVGCAPLNALGGACIPLAGGCVRPCQAAAHLPASGAAAVLGGMLHCHAAHACPALHAGACLCMEGS